MMDLEKMTSSPPLRPKYSDIDAALCLPPSGNRGASRLGISVMKSACTDVRVSKGGYLDSVTAPNTKHFKGRSPNTAQKLV